MKEGCATEGCVDYLVFKENFVWLPELDLSRGVNLWSNFLLQS